ncbi:hypothetical protein MMC15_001312 [Xylographa vitiligo]|nr:hypothetical protein [Xylographa vitiligo]
MTPPDGTQDGSQILEQLATVAASHHDEILAPGRVYQPDPGLRHQHENSQIKHQPTLSLQHCYSRDYSEMQSHEEANSSQPRTERQYQPRGYEVQNPDNPFQVSQSPRIQQESPGRPDSMMNKQGRAMTDLELGTTGFQTRDQTVHAIPSNIPQAVPHRYRNGVAPVPPKGATYVELSTESN